MNLLKDIIIGCLVALVAIMYLNILKQKIALITAEASIEAYRNELEATWRTGKSRVNSAYICRKK